MSSSLCMMLFFNLLVSMTPYTANWIEETSNVPSQSSNLNEIPPDLTIPKVTDETPSAGKRVHEKIADYAETPIQHLLYLPTDWKPNLKYPVVVEYPGRGGFSNRLGDHCDGSLEGCKLGYGISGGQGMLWVVLPFLDSEKKSHQTREWGDPKVTAEYCRAAVKHVCERWGGDSSRLILTGFSRGALACGTVGLYDDETAKLWRAIICHSHFDGVRTWNYPGSDRQSAKARWERLGQRPLFISQETSVDDIAKYLDESGLSLKSQLMVLPYPNHTDAWILKDIPERANLRKWVHDSIQ